MNEPTNFERLICKAVDQIYNENVRMYKLAEGKEWLESAWHMLNGLHHLLTVCEEENKQSMNVLMQLVKSYQDRIRDQIKVHYDKKVM